MAKNDTQAFPKELLDQLLAGRDPKTVLDSGGLIGELKKALAERMLNAEMDVHLDNEAEAGVSNHRNGYSAKTLLTPEGSMELSIPRDRHGRFDPQPAPQLVELNCDGGRIAELLVNTRRRFKNCLASLRRRSESPRGIVRESLRPRRHPSPARRQRQLFH